jgi:hypothetical protein
MEKMEPGRGVTTALQGYRATRPRVLLDSPARCSLELGYGAGVVFASVVKQTAMTRGPMCVPMTGPTSLT